MKLVAGRMTYSISVLHCLFVYLMLRAKAAKLGLWVVSYFILCSLKKYVIHVFFWRLPGRKKSRIIGGWGFKLSAIWKRTRKYKNRLSLYSMRFTVKPTRFAWTSANRDRSSVVSTNDTNGQFVWARSRSLINFWWKNHYNVSFSRLVNSFNWGSSRRKEFSTAVFHNSYRWSTK